MEVSTRQTQAAALPQIGRKPGQSGIRKRIVGCARWGLLLGSFLAALAAFLFFCAPFDPGEISWPAGWALAFTAGWTAWIMYRLAE